MEGNGKKCDFGQNCKNKALNMLTNCSKLTINHLRYLKSNLKELEIAEKYLILNRAGINQLYETGREAIFMVVSKSGNPGPGPVPNSYFLYYIFIKAFILIKFEHNA